MADKRVVSNLSSCLWVLPRASVKNINAITVDEMKQAVSLVDASSWDDTTFPQASKSEEQSSLSLGDYGNVSSRGAANYEATITAYYPRDVKDTTSNYAKAWQMFRNTRVDLILITRVGQGNKDAPVAAGQWYCAYHMMSSTYENKDSGDNPVRYTVGFKKQGNLCVNGLFTDGSASLTNTSAVSVSVGQHKRLQPKMFGHRVGSAVTYRSLDTTKATVSDLGVVTGRGTGSTKIEITHAALSAPVQVDVTVS